MPRRKGYDRRRPRGCQDLLVTCSRQWFELFLGPNRYTGSVFASDEERWEVGEAVRDEWLAIWEERGARRPPWAYRHYEAGDG